MACSGCSKKKVSTVLTPKPNLDMTQEEVVWAVQPMGMTLYISANGQRYMAHKRGQIVTVLKADHQELLDRGLISV